MWGEEGLNFLDKKSCQHLDCLSIKIPNTYYIHRNDILITIHPCPTCDCDPPFTRLDCQNCGTNIQCKTSYTTSTILCVQRRSCWKLTPSPLGPRLDHRTHTKLCHPASRQRRTVVCVALLPSYCGVHQLRVRVTCSDNWPLPHVQGGVSRWKGDNDGDSTHCGHCCGRSNWKGLDGDHPLQMHGVRLEYLTGGFRWILDEEQCMMLSTEAGAMLGLGWSAPSL